MFSYPLPFADLSVAVTPNIPSPLASQTPSYGRVTATPARAYHTISAWSPFQRAQSTSALFCQTLFSVIKSVSELHRVFIWARRDISFFLLLCPPRCLLPSLFVFRRRGWGGLGVFVHSLKSKADANDVHAVIQ